MTIVAAVIMVLALFALITCAPCSQYVNNQRTQCHQRDHRSSNRYMLLKLGISSLAKAWIVGYVVVAFPGSLQVAWCIRLIISQNQ
jgi:hypothetical protein